MNHWYDDLPGVTGALPLDASQLTAWPDRAMDVRLCHLRHCPVLPQELYQIARHLPLTVVDQPSGPMVMTELALSRLRRPAFDAEGRYLRSYRPLVTRLLPFCATPKGGLLRLIDTEAAAGAERPEELRRQIVQMLRAQAAGLARMTDAAKVLLGAGLLVRGSDSATASWEPPPEGLTVKTSVAIGNLLPAPDCFFALRLLAVLEFSTLHRRETQGRRGDADSLRELLGRHEILRRQTFLTRDDALDFSALRPHDRALN